MRIGIDFDNTLVCYDTAFAEVGIREGLLPCGFDGGKSSVKQALLSRRPDGYLWERLQGLVYGRHLNHARLFDGVDEFLRICQTRKDVAVYIVSHKTAHGHHDPERIDLRRAARSWMQREGFFETRRFGLCPEQVFFESTREEKIARIRAVACDVFVDDLAAVLGHRGMPAGCRKILFSAEPSGGFERYQTWYEIRDALFPGT